MRSAMNLAAPATSTESLVDAKSQTVAHASKASHFLITVFKNSTQVYCQTWNTEKLLGIGHPFKWMLERTTHGIRIRDLTSALGVVQSDATLEIPFSALKTQKTVLLSHTFELKIHPITALTPAFSNTSIDHGTSGSQLNIYTCLQQSIQAVDPLKNAFTASLDNKKIFKIKRSGNDFEIHSLIKELKIKTRDQEFKKISANESATLSLSTLLQSTVISEGNQSWKFGHAISPTIAHTDFSQTSRLEQGLDHWYRKSVKTATGILGLVLVALLFTPKAEEKKEEALPPQLAKIIMSPAFKKTQDVPSAGEGQKSVTKAKDAAVVQAFRTKNLQNAVSGLLKGGMSKLLAQSNLTLGANPNAGHLFRSGSKDMNTPGPQGQAQSLTVASVGGTGMGGTAGGTGVSYGSGKKAGVSGQGQGFVELDLGGSTVSTGLSMDEVGKVILSHINEVRYCYESAMIRSPEVEGKLVIDFAIAGAGNVQSGAVKSSSLADPRLDDCILRRLVTWKFPQPKGGVTVAVTYPFILKSLGR